MNRVFDGDNARRAKALGYSYEAHLRGLEQAAQAAFVILAEGFSPTTARKEDIYISAYAATTGDHHTHDHHH